MAAYDESQADVVAPLLAPTFARLEDGRFHEGADPKDIERIKRSLRPGGMVVV